MAKKGFGCERPECASSTGIDWSATFGTGKLDPNGFWEFPCAECANAWRLWQKWGKKAPTQAGIDALIERIRPPGADIREKADDGDNLCKAIMLTYQMLRNKPDSATFGILEGLMDNYGKEQVTADYNVKLTYFKSGGKYYSGGEYQTKKKDLGDIWDEVRHMRSIRHLPGLAEGCSEFVVLIEVPDHPHNHPRLIV